MYTRSHEWVRVEDDGVVVGVTDYAQNQMGDVVFVDFPAIGKECKTGEGVVVVESVKAVSDVYAPVSGIVVAINEALEDSPEKVNEDCYGEGWLIKIKPLDAGELENLLSAADYEALLGE